MYNSHLSLEEQARRLERNSEWSEASYKWLLAGRKEDSKACNMIADAIAKGDRFRELTGDANIQLEKRIINLSQYTEILNKAHKEVYGN